MDHMAKVPVNANIVERCTIKAKMKRKMMLIPSSAGTTAAAFAANCSFSFMAIKRKAMTIVEGRVPSIPPTFVPYRSAIIVIKMTTNAERKNGITIW